MFFDATAKHDGSVVDKVDKLFSCCVATEKTHANDKPMPPLVKFVWGGITSFPAYVTSVSVKYSLFTPQGVPIRATCTVSLQEMPGEKKKQNPTSGALAARSHAPGHRRRHAGLDRLQRIRRPDALAAVGLFQPGRRSAADAAGQCADAAQRRGTDRAGRTEQWHRPVPPSSSRSTARRCRPMPRRCWSPPTSTTACGCPDTFVLRFRDSERIVIAKSGAKIGGKVKIAVASDASTSPEPLIQGEITALEAEYDSTGTYTVIRGYDQAHRLFRGRRTETYIQSTASDVATKVAQRAGLTVGTVESTSTVFDHLSQGGVTDWEFLESLAKQIGYEIAVKDGKFDFRKPAKADTAPAGGKSEAENPLVLRLGTDLLRFRSLVTAAEQVKEVQARGWDLAQKKAFVATAPAKTTSAVLATHQPGRHRQDLQ